jgi:hypothetical protein
MWPHHDPAAQVRPDRCDALGHGRGRCDDHVRTAGGQVHHRRLAPDGSPHVRVEPGLLALSEEVQRIAQQGPPRSARGDEADIVERHPSAADPAGEFAAYQPARSDPPPRADNLDILPSGALEVAAQLNQEPGGAAHLASGRVHDYGGGHRWPAWRSGGPPASAARQNARRRSADRVPGTGHGSGYRPAESDTASHHRWRCRCRDVRR